MSSRHERAGCSDVAGESAGAGTQDEDQWQAFAQVVKAGGWTEGPCSGAEDVQDAAQGGQTQRRAAAVQDRATQPFPEVDAVLLVEDNLIAQLQVVVQGKMQNLTFLVRNGGKAEHCALLVREIAEEVQDTQH